jgi:hypothetical protein
MKLREIQENLNGLDIPKQVQLNKHTLIHDTKLFIESHISYVVNYKDTRNIYMPYYSRLIELLNLYK